MPNDKPLKPDDFPVEVEGEELVTADGTESRLANVVWPNHSTLVLGRAEEVIEYRNVYV